MGGLLSAVVPEGCVLYVSRVCDQWVCDTDETIAVAAIGMCCVAGTVGCCVGATFGASRHGSKAKSSDDRDDSGEVHGGCVIGAVARAGVGVGLGRKCG